MIRRGNEWGFAFNEFVEPGDFLIDEHMNNAEVESVFRKGARIPGTNTLHLGPQRHARQPDGRERHVRS